MGRNVAGVAQVSGNSPGVHTSMCNGLRTLTDKISCLIPAIESARPGCRLGIVELCSLNNSLEKAKLLIEHFAESSKLYLVITGYASVSRCEHLRDAIDQSLSHIQTMVPEPLASQILNAIDSLRDTKFVIDSSAMEAQNALLSLLQQNNPTESSELEAFQIVASKLHLTSSKALLVERRCVKKLLEKFSGTDSKKERMLIYLMHLLTTYGKKVQTGAAEYNENVSVVGVETQRKSYSSGEVSFEISTPIEGVQEENHPEYDIQSNLSSGALTPEEFLCPITSTLMYDPVVIASGQTFERLHIEKWFNEGHNTCPKTQMKLPNLRCTPNVYLKARICQWCKTEGIILRGPYLKPNSEPFCSWSSDTLSSSSTSCSSISGVILGSGNEDYNFQSNCSNTSIISSEANDSSHPKGILNLGVVNHANMFMWSDDYQKYKSFSCFSYDSYLKFLSELSQLPVEVHCKALEDLKLLLSKGDNICCLMLSNGFLESLAMFLKNAYDSSHVIAQKAGLHILLDFLKYSRVDLSSRSDKVCSLFTCILDSKKVNLESLKIIRAFCSYQGCKSAIAASDVTWQIIDTLNSDDHKLLEAALDILDQLSSVKEAALVISSPVCLLKLSSLISENDFARVCLKILQNLCHTKEGGTEIAKADGCLSSIVENLEYGDREEQAIAVSVLLSLRSWNPENPDLVMKEGVIPSLVDLSVNGNAQSRRDSTELLQILRDHSRRSDCLESSDGMRGLPSPSPSTTKLDPIHYNSENEILQKHHTHPEKIPFPFDASGSKSPMGDKKLGKKSSTGKSSGLFGRRFSMFSKH